MKKLILTLALVAGTAQAGTFWDGNKLLSKLRGETMEQMQALGYIMGVSDAVDTITVCSPTTVTSGQMLKVRANQELLGALNLMHIDCQYLHHEKNDRHLLSEPCPVEERIRAAIAKGEKA